MKYRRSDPHAAATAIQAAWRGYSVRRTHPLKHLRVIRNVRGELQKLEHELATDPKVVEAMRRDRAERLRWSERGMALLLQLDSMQGVHPVVREHRKALNKDVTMFQEYIDSTGAKGAHVPYVQSSLRRPRKSSSRRDPSPPPQLYHYCATGWMPHTPYVAAAATPPGRQPPAAHHPENSYYPPQRENSYRPPQQGPPQQENSYRPSQQENSYYPPQGPPPGTHQHSRTSSSYGHPGVNPHAHMPYVPTVPGERRVGHFPPESETTYHHPQAPGPPHGAHQSTTTSYPSYVNPHAHMAYVPTVPGERPVGHFPPESETTHYPQASGPSRGTHQYNGRSYSSYPPQPPVNPYAHMPYVPTVPGERPVGHFPVDPETTYPPQAPRPARGTHQYNHSSNTQPAVPNNPSARIPYVPTVPGDRRERSSEPARMYYPAQLPAHQELQVQFRGSGGYPMGLIDSRLRGYGRSGLIDSRRMGIVRRMEGIRSSGSISSSSFCVASFSSLVTGTLNLRDCPPVLSPFSSGAFPSVRSGCCTLFSLLVLVPELSVPPSTALALFAMK